MHRGSRGRGDGLSRWAFNSLFEMLYYATSEVRYWYRVSFQFSI